MSSTVLIETPNCPWCHKFSVVEVPAAGLVEYMNGAHIQNAFPDLTANQRELLKTGTHAACWDQFVPGDE